MRQFAVSLAALLTLPYLALAQQPLRDADLIVHGTINVALANKNGLVVLTDSVLTDGSGHQLPESGEKLFKLDDRTVCSIAGFVSATAPISDLSANTSAIIHEYVSQSARQGPQSIKERLRALSFLLNLHLSAIANVRDAGGYRTSIDTYGFS